jgi:hypothetical protein
VESKHHTQASMEDEQLEGPAWMRGCSHLRTRDSPLFLSFLLTNPSLGLVGRRYCERKGVASPLGRTQTARSGSPSLRTPSSSPDIQREKRSGREKSRGSSGRPSLGPRRESSVLDGLMGRVSSRASCAQARTTSPGERRLTAAEELPRADSREFTAHL